MSHFSIIPSLTHIRWRNIVHLSTTPLFEILIQILRFSGRKQLANNQNETNFLTILTDLAGSRVGGRWIVTCRRGSIRAGRGLWDFVRLGPIRVPLTVLGRRQDLRLRHEITYCIILWTSSCSEHKLLDSILPDREYLSFPIP